MVGVMQVEVNAQTSRVVVQFEIHRGSQGKRPVGNYRACEHPKKATAFLPEGLGTATNCGSRDVAVHRAVRRQSGGKPDREGARGGPLFLALQPFRPGINSGSKFNPNAFSLYSRWANASGPNAAARQSIARGEMLFNNRPMNISVVPRFNDVQGQDLITGTCTSCHNTPNVGSDSSFAMMNIGTVSPSEDLPSYTLQCNDGSGVTVSDPGRALVTGKCIDIGKFKFPGMRGLAARAPYFHNGSAATLLDVVNFYDQRFNMALTDEEKADLVAFMNTL
jgi:cytochrome c peroxidase